MKKLNLESLESRHMMAGDTILDQMTDIRDNYGQEVEVGTNGDFDKNGIVDFKDFLLVAKDLKTLNAPVKWVIPNQRSATVDRLIKNGWADLTISVTNKNGTFESTCENILLGNLKTGNTRCKIVVDASNLQATDDPWEISYTFQSQNISPTVNIRTVTAKRLIRPATLLTVPGTSAQFAPVDLRYLLIRRTIPFPPPQFPRLEQPYPADNSE